MPGTGFTNASLHIRCKDDSQCWHQEAGMRGQSGHQVAVHDCRRGRDAYGRGSPAVARAGESSTSSSTRNIPNTKVDAASCAMRSTAAFTNQITNVCIPQHMVLGVSHPIISIMYVLCSRSRSSQLSHQHNSEVHKLEFFFRENPAHMQRRPSYSLQILCTALRSVCNLSRQHP